MRLVVRRAFRTTDGERAYFHACALTVVDVERTRFAGNAGQADGTTVIGIRRYGESHRSLASSARVEVAQRRGRRITKIEKPIRIGPAGCSFPGSAFNIPERHGEQSPSARST
jgi:hypothetical protein